MQTILVREVHRGDVLELSTGPHLVTRVTWLDYINGEPLAIDFTLDNGEHVVGEADAIVAVSQRNG